MRRLLGVVLALLLLAPAAAGAQTVEGYFRAGNARMEANDPKGAFAQYLQGLALAPEEPELLYNAGLAAYLSDDFRSARDLWARYRKVAPTDYSGLVKLIQADQALGDARAVASEIADLRRWWRSRKNRDLSKETSFVRHQFLSGKRRVYAFEFFAPDPDRRDHTWDFVVTGPDGEQEAMYYVMQDKMAGEVAGKDMWFLDVRTAQYGATLTTFTYAPTFEEAVSLVQMALAGEKPPVLLQK